MIEKLYRYILYSFLVLGVFFVFAGALIPPSPVEVTQIDYPSEYTDEEYVSIEDVSDIEEEYTSYSIVGDNLNIRDNYDIDSFSNETQSDIMKLINNEQDSITSSELYRGEFIINVDDKSYLFQGIQEYGNPIWISIWGYIIITSTALLYASHVQPQNKTKTKTNIDGIIRGDEQSEWKYIIEDDEENE